MKKDMESTATLNDGVQIPYLGLGTWQSRGKKCVQAVAFALTHGYSLIDTAQAYNNELQVGEGWRASGRQREEVFLTTKIRNDNQGYQSSRKSFDISLEKLQTDYVDLLLIHWPKVQRFDRTLETWQALVEIQAEGMCRSIGVSNFTIPLLEQLLAQSDVTPAVNQVEFHTFLYQKELLEFCQAHQIQIEAYSPIARTKFFDNERIQKVAQKHGKTPAQVMLAWGVSHDLVVIPKSTHQGRIEENTDIFFDLDKEDLDLLDNIAEQKRLITGGPF